MQRSLRPKEQAVLPRREMQGTTGILGKPTDTDTAQETPEEQALDKSWRQIIQSKRILQTAFQQDEWLHPDSSCHSLPVPPGPVWT